MISRPDSSMNCTSTGSGTLVGCMQMARKVLISFVHPRAPLKHRTTTVLQACGVGGGVLVNNAVCFRPPKPIFDRWANVDFPVSEAERARAYDAVALELDIIPASAALAPNARRVPLAIWLAIQ